MPYFADSDSRLQLPLDRQRTALTEAELRQHVRALAKAFSEHWAAGVHTAIDLGLVLEEKHRRMKDSSGAHPWRQLAAWLETCVCLEEDEDLEQLYLLTGADCRKLVLRVAHIWDDVGLDRPRFIDIAK